jgi:1-acyl-sn-glycerol-3-phosphate acyltransferase
VTVAYLRLDGMPLGRFYRPFIAWYGAMQVAPHLWTVIGLGRISVRVIFHPVVTLDQFSSRKDLAVHCYKVIAAGLAAALAGRGPGSEADIEDEPEDMMADVDAE